MESFIWPLFRCHFSRHCSLAWFESPCHRMWLQFSVWIDQIDGFWWRWIQVACNFSSTLDDGACSLIEVNEIAVNAATPHQSCAYSKVWTLKTTTIYFSDWFNFGEIFLFLINWRLINCPLQKSLKGIEPLMPKIDSIGVLTHDFCIVCSFEAADVCSW